MSLSIHNHFQHGGNVVLLQEDLTSAGFSWSYVEALRYRADDAWAGTALRRCMELQSWGAGFVTQGIPAVMDDYGTLVAIPFTFAEH